MYHFKNCKKCGKEILSSARICPYCGKKQKPPILEIILLTLCIFGLIGQINTKSMVNSSTEVAKKSLTTNKQEISVPTPTPVPTPKPKPTVEISTDELLKVLNENALKASMMYKNKIVKLTGRLTNIDAQGKYFTLGPIKQQYTFVGVHCSINKDHIDTVLNFINGQSVTVTGQITIVGEVLGYTLEVDSIEE
jgi:hypothetical protein